LQINNIFPAHQNKILPKTYNSLKYKIIEKDITFKQDISMLKNGVYVIKVIEVSSGNLILNQKFEKM